MHYMNFELDPWAAAILDHLSKHQKLDAGHGFMPLCIEKLSEKRLAIAHYFEQNGDLVQDPEMVFLRTATGWLPLSIQHSFGPVFEAFVLDDAEQPVGVRRQQASSQKSFAHLWLANIVRQQDLKLPVPEEGEE